MRYSENAVELIKHFEGCKLRSYRDVAGVWTIGYGHTKGVYPGMVISEDEAESLLRDDLIDHAKDLDYLLEVDVTQDEFDALLSFVFNLGSPALERSTLLRKLNRGESGVSKEFNRWNKARNPATGKLEPVAGLIRRRKSERHLYETGVLSFFE